MLSVPELIKMASKNIRKIDAATAFAECLNVDGLVIDVREPGEVSANPVEGSMNIPRGVLEMKISELQLDSDKPIYIHCATSARATLSAEQLQRIGYTHVSAISSTLDAILQAKQEGRK